MMAQNLYKEQSRQLFHILLGSMYDFHEGSKYLMFEASGLTLYCGYPRDQPQDSSNTFSENLLIHGYPLCLRTKRANLKQRAVADGTQSYG